MFRIGWFSTGRDEAARDLLRVVFECATLKGRLFSLDYPGISC